MNRRIRRINLNRQKCVKVPAEGVFSALPAFFMPA